MFDCILPAAGASSRMGGFKPLLPFPAGGGGCVVEAAASAARGAGCRVILVVGHRGAEVAARFAAERGVLVAHNAVWERGMLGSIVTGLRLVTGEAFFVAPADMPLIPSTAYALLGRAWEAARARGEPEAALFSAHRGERGHPVLVPSAWAADIAALDPSSRLRDFLSTRPWIAIESGGDGVLADLDTVEDYEAALARAAGGGFA